MACNKRREMLRTGAFPMREMPGMSSNKYYCLHRNLKTRRSEVFRIDHNVIQRSIFVCEKFSCDCVTDLPGDKNYKPCNECDAREIWQLPNNPTWSVGITTAFRSQPTLRRTLNSLIQSGWSEGLIFAESNSNDLDSVSETNFNIIQNTVAPNAWKNWIKALRYLSESKPDLIFIAQDDVEFAKNSKQWILNNWPQYNGIVSLYDSNIYSRSIDSENLNEVWKLVPNSMPFVGALAIIIPNYLAQKLLLQFESNREFDINNRHIDIKIGKLAKAFGIPINIPKVSRCQHIGDKSTLYPYARNTGNRSSGSYICD
jgi:hypothetical protein